MRHDEVAERAIKTKDEKTVTYTELVLNKYSDYHTRADVVFVRSLPNDTYLLTGIEAKSSSESDDISRLPEQVESYYRSCATVDVWAPNKKVQEVKRITPECVGVVSVSELGYNRHRMPRDHYTDLTPNLFLKALWRREVLKLAKMLDVILDHINGHMSTQDIRKVVLSQRNKQKDDRLYSNFAKILYDR